MLCSLRCQLHVVQINLFELISTSSILHSMRLDWVELACESQAQPYASAGLSCNTVMLGPLTQQIAQHMAMMKMQATKVCLGIMLHLPCGPKGAEDCLSLVKR